MLAACPSLTPGTKPQRQPASATKFAGVICPQQVNGRSHRQSDRLSRLVTDEPDREAEEVMERMMYEMDACAGVEAVLK
ncbi:hypothetical protein LMH87_003493 [Akanthomyces muscarius]|uniref:Uncharacterized protein n=1 Tax=Akanthomyces muscarius TaxID=2231603 RepID=A0A9W8Q268_AKAMU|nr:hypothetical protein LMH87_003493 [Akanthomyces muscarius]KAJ4144618.1 hypothetical protein LMH87_003493 [Akanthomyces muscarius]